MTVDPFKAMRMIAKVVYTQVKKRGGRVSIPIGDIPSLVMNEWESTVCGSHVEFTLKPSEVRRSSDRYSDKFLYRLDIALKYLIATSPEQKITISDEDLAISRMRFSFEALSNDSLTVVIDPSDEAIGPDDRLLLGRDTSVIVFDGAPPVPGRKLN